MEVTQQASLKKETEKQKIVIISAGTFAEDRVSSGTEESIGVAPIEIHLGFIKKRQTVGEWTNEQIIQVKYVGGKNLEVSVEISNHQTSQFDLAYTIKFCTLPRKRNENFQTENRFITLDEPEGRYVKLPILNFSKHPFGDHRFSIQAHNLHSSKFEFEEKVKLRGKITTIYYGLTTSNQQDYMNSRDLPWKNTFGEYKLEGQLQVYHLNTAKEMNIPAEKAVDVMNDVWIRVPKGKNVLWKVGYDRWEISESGIVSFSGHFETETFFYSPL